MQRNRSLSALWSGALLVASVLSADVAFGHGWVTSPPSRQDHCAKGRTSFDCGQVRYEPQSVEAPKGAMSCSGGSSFSILDNHGLGWPVTNIGSTATVTWFCTACHRTRDWEYFVNGNRIGFFSGNNQQPSQTVSHTLSGLPAGRQRILARWNIGDTAMAFYACLDVQVGGGGNPTPRPTNPTPRPTGNPTATPRPTASPTTIPGGTWRPGVAYSVGATVTYGGRSYRCRQAHTSQVGWEPASTLALWLPI